MRLQSLQAQLQIWAKMRWAAVKVPSTSSWKYLQYHPPHRMRSVVIGKLTFLDKTRQSLKAEGIRLVSLLFSGPKRCRFSVFTACFCYQHQICYCNSHFCVVSFNQWSVGCHTSWPEPLILSSFDIFRGSANVGIYLPSYDCLVSVAVVEDLTFSSRKMWYRFLQTIN